MQHFILCNHHENIVGEILEQKFCPDSLNTYYLVLTLEAFYVIGQHISDSAYAYHFVLKTRNKLRALEYF